MMCGCSYLYRASSSIAVLFFFASVSCQQQQADRDAVILESENVSNERGYNYRYTTSNGIERSETGTYHSSPTGPVLRVNGFYQYLLNGKKYGVSYRANENGYQAKQFEDLNEIDNLWTTVAGISRTTTEKGIKVKTLDGQTGDEVIDTRIGTPVLATLIGGGVG